MVLGGKRYDGVCTPLKVVKPAGEALAPGGSGTAFPALLILTTGELVKLD